MNRGSTVAQSLAARFRGCAEGRRPWHPALSSSQVAFEAHRVSLQSGGRQADVARAARPTAEPPSTCLKTTISSTLLRSRCLNEETGRSNSIRVRKSGGNEAEM